MHVWTVLDSRLRLSGVVDGEGLEAFGRDVDGACLDELL